MRRRIYINPEGDLNDRTDSPYLYDLDQEQDAPMEMCRTGALYDEALWALYEAACEESYRLRGLVRAALTHEPWDAVERDLATRAVELGDRVYDCPTSELADLHAELKAIDARAVEHAKGCVRLAMDGAAS